MGYDVAMSRQVTNKTKLGALIRKTGEPAYKIAAATNIAFSQLSRYVNMIDPIKAHHLRTLCEFFEVEPDDVIGLVDAAEPSGDRAGAVEALDGVAG